MLGLVMFAKVFARPVKASLHCGDAGRKDFGDFGMAAALLDQREQGAILRPELAERMAEGIELLGVNRAGRFRDILMFLSEGQKDPTQLLAPQLIDAGVPREPEQPRLELRRGLQPVERPDHLDEDLLGQVLHVIAAAGHGVNEACDPVLVADNELPLGSFVALLGSANEVSQRGR
jgi:hypothetical protein